MMKIYTRTIMLVIFMFLYGCSTNIVFEDIIVGDSLVYRNEWLIDDFSHGGWKIEDLHNNISSYDMYENIFILIGINNICHGWTDEEILNELEILYNSIKGNVYIISILPIVDSDFEWGDNGRIDNLNNELKKRYAVINVFDSLINKEGINPYTTDGVHLTKDGYSILETILYNYIK